MRFSYQLISQFLELRTKQIHKISALINNPVMLACLIESLWSVLSLRQTVLQQENPQQHQQAEGLSIHLATTPASVDALEGYGIQTGHMQTWTRGFLASLVDLGGSGDIWQHSSCDQQQILLCTPMLLP